MDMENEESEDAFQSSLEPDVIIDDDSKEDAGYYQSDSQEEEHNGNSKRGSQQFSLIPINQHSIKLKMPNLCGYGLEKVRKTHRSPRQTVRLITSEELLQADIRSSSLKRKSLPLEKCPICKKFFRRMKTHLQKHENMRRDPNDPLTCKFCMKAFNTGSNLIIHMRTHTGHKPYICEVCTKGFAQSCNLINHMRIHTGERPFKCPHCDRAFTQSGNLGNHVRLHTDEKPFKCHFCEKAFTQSGNLNSHIRNNHKFVINGTDPSTMQ
uniref:C2H2-type domain-containing protein n=1 Tax=Photinus pyralis TaxID=7054 RepID=A0A1Y1KUC5_PHOPY